jgi:hypothetical protein
MEARQWVAVEAHGGVRLPPVRFAVDHAGWRIVELHDAVPLVQLDDAVLEAAKDTGGSTVAFALHPDDMLYVVAADGSEVRARLAFGGAIEGSEEVSGALLRSFGEGGLPENHHRLGSDAFAQWSNGAPTPLLASAVPLWNANPDDAMDRLIDGLGLVVPGRGPGAWTGLIETAQGRAAAEPKKKKKKGLFRRKG